MEKYKYSDLYKNTSLPKYPLIETDGITITYKEIYGESFKLTERLCSERELRFGSCEAGVFKVRVINNAIHLKGRMMTVSEILKGGEDTPFIFGTYKVISDEPTADRRYRDITAYDSMYDILNAEVSNWYNTLLPDKDSQVTLRDFRNSFLAYFGIEQEEVTLVNDEMIVTKTIEPSSLSGKTVITAICEINGCFGHIGRDGRFQYIHLKQLVEGVYPAQDLYPAKDLYPAAPANSEMISKSYYTSCTYEDFKTQCISQIQIRQKENDIGGCYGSEGNTYIVQDNFLVYGKTTEEINGIAEKMYSVVKGISYRPATVAAKGNPCLSVGDGIRLVTRDKIVYTYILQRTLKGIQALKDTYESSGVERYSEKVNGVQQSIIQLKGKTNILERTVEETRLELKDIENGLTNQIRITAKGLEAEITSAKDNLQSKISANAKSIELKVSSGEVISSINATLEEVTILAEKIDLKGLVNADIFISDTITTKIMSAYSLEVDYKIKADTISGINGEIESLKTNSLTTKDLDAEDGKITNLLAEKLEADYLTASSIKANYMEVANWTTGKYIKAEKIDADNILSIIASADKTDVKYLTVTSRCRLLGTECGWKDININGTLYKVLCEVSTDE